MAYIHKFRGITNSLLSKINKDNHQLWSKWCGIEWAPGPKIPTGVIFPWWYNGAAPTNYGLYTAPNGYHIIGAGSTYSVGSTGGALTAGISISACGNHTGSSVAGPTGGGSGYDLEGSNQAAGTHSHTATLTYTPLYRQLQLIQVTTETCWLPAWAIVMAHSGADPFGLTQYFSGENSLLKANSSYGTGGGSTPSAVGSTSSGTHEHDSSNCGNGGIDSCGSTYDQKCYNQGAHTHTITPSSATHDGKRMMLTAWANASNPYLLKAGMIALYASVTPPSGWYFCDGNNGTPDMRDRMVMFGTTGNHGTPYGDNTIDFVWSNSAHGNHNHYYSTKKPVAYNIFYHSENRAHPNAHGTSQSGISYIPPYYGLAFIMYGG